MLPQPFPLIARQHDKVVGVADQPGFGPLRWPVAA
jgi:hypothetical protein